MASELIKRATKQVVEHLVTRRFDDLVRLTRGNRLTKEMMKTAIYEYGRELVLPPETAYNSLDVVKVNGATPPEWSVRFALWTSQEGRSDLSVELTVVEVGNTCEIELDDIRVL